MTELYTESYVDKQLAKFHDRKSNHWRNHIDLGKRLAAEYGPELPAKVLDLGCSIGTFALEFALAGYDSIGLDFDSKALEQAEILADELGVKIEWLCRDAADFSLPEPIEVIACFAMARPIKAVLLRQCIPIRLPQKG